MENETKQIGGKCSQEANKRKAVWEGGGPLSSSHHGWEGKQSWPKILRTLCPIAPRVGRPRPRGERRTVPLGLGLPFLRAPQLGTALGSKGRASTHSAEDRLLTPIGRGSDSFQGVCQARSRCRLTSLTPGQVRLLALASLSTSFCSPLAPTILPLQPPVNEMWRAAAQTAVRPLISPPGYWIRAGRPTGEQRRGCEGGRRRGASRQEPGALEAAPGWMPRGQG